MFLTQSLKNTQEIYIERERLPTPSSLCKETQKWLFLLAVADQEQNQSSTVTSHLVNTKSGPRRTLIPGWTNNARQTLLLLDWVLSQHSCGNLDGAMLCTQRLALAICNKQKTLLADEQKRWNGTSEPWPLDWTLSCALLWTPSWAVSWELSWGVLEGLKQGRSTLVINPRGSFRGSFRWHRPRHKEKNIPLAPLAYATPKQAFMQMSPQGRTSAQSQAWPERTPRRRSACPFVGLSWGRLWAHSWCHPWVKFRFRLLCATPHLWAPNCGSRCVRKQDSPTPCFTSISTRFLPQFYHTLTLGLQGLDLKSLKPAKSGQRIGAARKLLKSDENYFSRFSAFFALRENVDKKIDTS